MKDLARFVWMLREELRDIASKVGWYVGRVYRGVSGILPSRFNVGEKATFPSFTSTSRDAAAAANFSSAQGVIFVIDLQTGCGVKIDDYSKFKGEQEVLLRPYCNYVVTRIEGNKVYLTVTQP